MDQPGIVLLFGGPAGAGKSTLARAWCATRPRAVLIELDEVIGFIAAGLVDPQQPAPEQSRQYEAGVRGSCALARSYAMSGFDVALDDVLPPDAFQALWRPELAGLNFQVIIVLPSLEATLERSHGRFKEVKEELTVQQHAACSDWPPEARLDTTGMSVQEGLDVARERGLLP